VGILDLSVDLMPVSNQMEGDGPAPHGDSGVAAAPDGHDRAESSETG
jgi:hypothetical protein